MAEEEKNDKNQEEKPEEKAPEAEAEEKAPEAEAPAEEAPADDAPAEGEDEAPKEAKADAPQTGTPGAEGEDVPADEADEGMDWKARKRLERSRESVAAGPEKSAQERAAERAQNRAGAVKSRSSYRRKRREGRQPHEGTPPAERRAAARKVRQGRVVSNKSEKTITVKIDAARRHPAYEKIIRHSNTLRAHDERNEAGEGDLVRVVETRPLSRTKRWRLVEVLEKAK